MGSSEESPDKICSSEGCNLEDLTGAGLAQEFPSTVHPAGCHTGHTRRILRQCTCR